MNTGDVRAAWLAAIAERKRAFEGKFRTGPPRGDSYEAEVPDTLDLADRGVLAVNALTSPVEPEQDSLIYDQTLCGYFRRESIKGTEAPVVRKTRFVPKRLTGR